MANRKITRRIVARQDGDHSIHIGVQPVVGRTDPGIQIDVTLGADDQTVYLEAYHWFGSRQPIRIVSTTTGEAIDTQQPADRPHPEFAIVEVPA